MKWWSRVILFFLALAISQPSFAYKPQDLLMSIGADGSHVTLTSEQVREDIQYYLYALKQSYSGQSFLAKDFKTFKSGLSTLSKGAANSTDTLCQAIGGLMDKLPDSHIGISAMNERFEWKGCRATNQIVGSVGKNIAIGASVPWLMQEKQIGDQKISILGVRALTDPVESSVWSGINEAVQQALNSSPVFILDLRGNRGGGTFILENIVRQIYGFRVLKNQEDVDPEHPIPRMGTTWTQLDSAGAFAVRSNYQVVRIQSLIEVAKKPVDPIEMFYYRKMLKEVKEVIAKPIPVMNRKVSPTVPLTQMPIFKGKIYILTDRECGSSCEMGLDYFEFIPGIKTVGENTKGAIHITWVGRLYLPNSHLMATIPTAVYEYADGRNLETIGHAPSIKTPVGEDALDWLLKNVLSGSPSPVVD